MAPNGLIFLVVVAIWAAYLVQYWIRRRDHRATARSMDRFSESMRVLARRSALPQSSPETGTARSYAVSPTRSMRPLVLVKRADATTSSGLVANQVVGSAGSTPRGAAPLRPTPGDGGSGRAPRSAVPATSVRHATASAGVPQRVRGLLLVALLTVLLAVTVLAALGTLLWWAPLAALVAPAGALGWVRAGTRRRLAARTRRPRKASVRLRAARPRPARAATATQPPAGSAETEAGTEAETATEAHVGAPTDSELAEPYGFEAPAPHPALQPAAPSPAAQVDDDDIPLTWDPRPVPRPTYTMKARADRPLPAPAEVTPTPTPIGVDEDDDVRALEPQRHTG